MQKLIFFVVFALAPFSISAAPLGGLTLDGQYQPAVSATFPHDSDRSWFWWKFFGGGRITWFYGPGTDGGVIFGKQQQHPPYDDGMGGGTLNGESGELTSQLTFLNSPVTFFSDIGGLSVDANQTLDMSALRFFFQSDEFNLGAGPGIDPLVPLVADVTTLPDTENGWQINADGSYHLIYRTAWNGNPMTLHWTGNVKYQPAVSGFWPGSASPGSLVFVFGAGFESQTTVRVNGIDAPLVQVVADDLLLFVLPGGDTSGAIDVATVYGSGSSVLGFGSSPQGLQIAGQWPGAATVGTIVFVFGSGFDPAPGQTQVSINGVNVPAVQAIDESLLLFVVNNGLSTGPVTVTTPVGSVTGTEVLEIN